MIIHSHHRIRSERVKQKRLKGKRWLRSLLIISISVNIIIFTGAFIGGGFAIRKAIKKGAFEEAFDKSFGKFKRQVLGSVYYAKSLLLPDIPKIGIDINFKNYKKLMEKIEEAKRIGILFTSNQDFVPAVIRYKGKSTPVNVRLKGVNIDQFLNNKFGLRIKTRGNYRFKGMRLFSFHDPEQRSYMYEWGCLENLRREGILAPRYEFVDVSINGKHMGIYALEENFSKELLESQGRREGVILKYNSETFWRQLSNWIYDPDAASRSMAPHYPEFFILQPRNWLNSDIDAFQSTRVATRETLSIQRDSAIGLLEAYRTGKKKASEVFDVPLLTKFLAIAHLWGGEHGIGSRNIRFYFNPVTYKIEPIGYDLMCGQWDEITENNAQGKIESTFPWNDFDWIMLALQDKTVTDAYIKEALRVSSPEYLVDLKQKLKKDLNRQLRILWREKPEIIDWKKIEDNQRLYRNVLYPVETILAYLDPEVIEYESRGTFFVKISVKNLLTLPVVLRGFKINNEAFVPFTEEVLFSQDVNINDRSLNKFILEGVNPFVEERIYEFYIPIDSRLISNGRVPVDTKVQILNSMLGNPREHLTDAIFMPKPKFIEGIPPTPLSIQELLTQHPYLDYSGERNEIYIQKGDWKIKGDLVLPKNTKLVIDSDTTLKFGVDAVLVVNGASAIFKGTEDNPIRLSAQKESWSGLVVLNSPNKSILENVIIENTSSIERRGWILTGGVTFYQSPVDFNLVQILDSHGEDAVNFINTKFKVSNSIFSNCFSDALDSDFCTGIIKNTVFSKIGGDAIDVSVTRIEANDIKTYSIGDKGISVGEKSKASIHNFSVEQARFGIVSKDLSEVEIDTAQIINVEYGLAAYQKKPEYGPAKIDSHNVIFTQVQKETLCQNSSSININGKQQLEKQVDVDKLYEGQGN